MENVQRRTMLKSLGMIFIEGLFPLSDAQAAAKNSLEKRVVEDVDVLVVGGGTAGIMAALQAGRAGCRTLLLESGNLLGGTMTTGGVSFSGLFHAWGKQVIGGIGWELVSESVLLNDDSLPDFSTPIGTNHSKHQILLNGALFALLAEEKCLQAGVLLKYP